MLDKPICPYCESDSKLVTGLSIYPHRSDLAELSFYQCAPCEAYVGCHKGTTNALGRLANAELRQWKSIAHRVFDPIWRTGLIKRKEAYQALAREMGIEAKHCHIGMFDVDQCKAVYAICKAGKLIAGAAA